MNTSPPPGRERREHVRYLLKVPATLRYAGVDGQTSLLDISRAGVAFLSEKAIAPGMSFDIVFSPPGWSEDVHIAGTVVHNTHLERVGKFKVGGRLVDVSPQLAERIVDFIYSTLERVD